MEKKRNLMTEEVIEKILKLSATGLTKEQISKLLNISAATVYRAINAGSWEGYQRINRAQREYSKRLKEKRSGDERLSKREKEDLAKQAWDVAETPNTEDLYEQLREVNLKLDQIVSILIEKETKKETGFKPF